MVLSVLRLAALSRVAEHAGGPDAIRHYFAGGFSLSPRAANSNALRLAPEGVGIKPLVPTQWRAVFPVLPVQAGAERKGRAPVGAADPLRKTL